MTFNRTARIDPKRVQRRGRSAGSGGMAVGGGLGGILLLLLAMFLGLDVGDFSTGATGTAVQAPNPEVQAEFNERCDSGEAANEYTDCRILYALGSLDDYWESAAPALGVSFDYPGGVIFDGLTSTACGNASTQTGPFYCPGDQTIYIDPEFFDVLVDQFGSSDGPLAQIYVVAHEYGHHIQNVLGVFDVADRTQTGVNSDTVKVELMADCLAGVWTQHAANTMDENGQTLLQPITQAQINSALSAAAAVGDDRIQEKLQGQAQPHTYTHGTSEQRVNAFTDGYTHGSPAACDVFGVVDRPTGF